ncbi:T9SS type A sorting domain-containing protein [Pedobacter puniceum]|uniref:Secretion system C-terminal sorting domain-containing protein n=1 Tax=Pedobacter puniceum TaxID=2666136 RepID=A0A7K0FNT3_9SPHI|nr:T9SS type A sorting domain-containing protein [Pedobacter puniceum]MRX46910.1 hypothetical protein [Pedobacter puniceum]
MQLSQFPNVSKLAEPTSSYNCHNYAWVKRTGGNSFWLNSPGDDAFWNDNSYIQTINNGEGELRISYQGDHSAVSIGNSNLADSKWGSWGLYRHAITDVPASYLPNSTLTYYKKNDIIGPIQSCPNETYSIQNLPSGFTVTWSATGSIGITGSNTANPVSTTSLYNGTGVLTATITTTCGQTITTTKSITPLVIEGPSALCENSRYTIANLPVGATTTWSVTSGYVYSYGNYPNGTASISSYDNNYADLNNTSDGWVTIQANITTSCGNKTLTKHLMAGLPPWDANMYVTYSQGYGYSFNVNALTYPGATSCEWYLDGILMDPSTNCFGATLDVPFGSAYYNYFQYTYYGNHTITAIAHTACGDVTVEHQFNTNSNYFAISPNPADEELVVSTHKNNEDVVLTAESQKIYEKFKNKNKLESENFLVKLLNDKGEILSSGNMFNGKITINTKSIPNGIYFLHVLAGKEVIKKQILISHK